MTPIKISWDGIEEARQEAGRYIAPDTSKNADTIVKEIADSWAETLRSNWEYVFRFYPDRVAAIGKANNGILTNGIFAGSFNGRIASEMRSIVLNNNAVEYASIPTGACTGLPCASGMVDVFTEMVSLKSVRSQKEYGKFFGPTILRVFRLVDLARAYDSTGEIGGKIDAVELLGNGTVRWFARKDNCPAN